VGLRRRRAARAAGALRRRGARPGHLLRLPADGGRAGRHGRADRRRRVRQNCVDPGGRSPPDPPCSWGETFSPRPPPPPSPWGGTFSPPPPPPPPPTGPQ